MSNSLLLSAVFALAVGVTRADQVTLTCADPYSVTAVNPARPSIGGSAPGGLDEGMVGDTDRILLGLTEVGKQCYQTNDAVTIYLMVSGPVTIEVGHLRFQYGSARAEALLDGALLGAFSAYSPKDQPATEKYEAQGTGKVQALTIRPCATSGAPYVFLDAVRFTAATRVQIVDAKGRPALIPSAALPPDKSKAILAQLATVRNLVALGGDMTHLATEEFATGIEGSKQYSVLAALSGGQSYGGYWAGGTPPPHALVLSWKEQITFNTHRILWLGENRGVWYGLEYWDGAGWRLLYEEKRNLQSEPIYQFPRVSTGKVRLTVVSLIGQQRVLMKDFDLYHLPEGGEKQIAN